MPDDCCLGKSAGGCFPALVTVPATATAATLTDKLEWFGTIRGRVGFTVTPNVLLYATGGGAFGEVRTDLGLAAVTAAGVPWGSRRLWERDRFGCTDDWWRHLGSLELKSQLERGRSSTCMDLGARLNQSTRRSRPYLRQLSSRGQSLQSRDGQHHSRRHQTLITSIGAAAPVAIVTDGLRTTRWRPPLRVARGGPSEFVHGPCYCRPINLGGD